jgi:hypothetical protein
LKAATSFESAGLGGLSRTMNGGVPEPGPRTVLYKLAREKLLDFTRSLESSTASPTDWQSPSITPITRASRTGYCERPVQDRGNLVQAPIRIQKRKRRSDEAPEVEPIPSAPKRARLAGPQLQQLSLQPEQTESDPKAKLHKLVIDWLDSIHADGSVVPSPLVSPEFGRRGSDAWTPSQDASAERDSGLAQRP